MWRFPPLLAAATASAEVLDVLARFKDKETQKWLTDSKCNPTEVLEASIFTIENALRRLARETVLGGGQERIARQAFREACKEPTIKIIEALESAWTTQNIELPAEPPLASESTVTLVTRRGHSGPVIWLRAAEDFLAIRVASFIHVSCGYLRSCLAFSLIGFLLLMAALNSYPFQPVHPLLAVVWIVGLIGIACVTWVILDMDRNFVLSLIGKSEVGKVTLSWDLVTHVLLYAVLPLLTILASQFPSLGDSILAALSPFRGSR
jgi:hypothetical protein